ncbi:hypothetical protein ABR737_16885 [Streptomyces sp. Edi2]|uniref:hypothetical protein n=1 Tax=Streptomyces sp. Edi2 TaxID=3162528 RepID=UPI0033059457
MYESTDRRHTTGMSPAVRSHGGIDRQQRAGRALTLAGYAAYGLFPLSGAIAVTLMVLTGSWYWMLLVPPVAYGARQLTKGLRPRD